MIDVRGNLARFEPVAFAALRIVSGSLLFCHGAQKILGWLTTRAGPAPGSQLWIGGVLELSCGALVAAGLVTRGAAFIAAGMMAVAYTQYHWKLDFAGGRFFPIVNGGELAVAYCFVFLFVFAHGPGGASLDALLFRKFRKPTKRS